MTNLDQMRICYRCDFATGQPLQVCPQCGQPQLRTSAQIRTLGWVLAVGGALLTIFMAWLSLIVGRIILQSDQPGATTRFTGGPEMVLFIICIFGVVLAFGMASFSAGIFQIKHGRRNKSLTKTVLVLGVVFLVVGVIVQAFV